MKPVVLIIRDGWGYRKDQKLNATRYATYAKTLMKKYPTTLIGASEEYAGLPKGYQGNSEVGHMTIGSGRIIKQSMVRINDEIKSKRFFKNTAFLKAIQQCKKHNTTLHILGLLQQEGVHAHINHCLALIDLCKKEKFENYVVHIISDGRDAGVKNTINNLKLLLKKVSSNKIATISGRYYAMDRDKRWDRTKKAYDAIVAAKSKETFTDPIDAFKKAYAINETDEFIVPKVAEWYKGVSKKDSIIFFNYRTDRTRQLTKAIIEDTFKGWDRKPTDVLFVAMQEYYKPMNKRAIIAFPPQKLTNVLGEVVAKAGMKQLRISETEKYAHVTFFFNGQVEKPNKGEDRILIPSPKVATYDLQPEMSVNEIGDTIAKKIDENKYDLIVTNFVNGDMVGHTGDWKAIVTAAKAVDVNVKKVVDKVLEKDGTAIVFADHGNCEDMTAKWRTSHTLNLVPCIVVSNYSKKIKLKKGKGIQDIAPTALKLLGIKKPKEMTGNSLF